MLRRSANVVLCNLGTSGVSGGFLLMMLLYLWPMLLSAVGWISSLFRSFSKFNLCTLQCIAKIVQLELYLTQVDNQYNLCS